MLVQENNTTAAVQRYLDDLAGIRGDSPAEPIVRALLERAADRLQQLCSKLLHRHYPRLTKGPANLHSEEMLGGVVERMLKAMRQVRPNNVRQFFALANRHMRWELNDLARRLAKRETTSIDYFDLAAAPQIATGEISESPTLQRILDVIESLPDEEREVFNLVRVQGMTYGDAADVIGCASKTVQRRLNRGLVTLEERLRDLHPASHSVPPDNGHAPSEA
jgi:RNA polymerase sigma factor (sigma-70 family)